MLNTGRLERIATSHILLLNGEIDLTSSLIIHTSEGDYNIGNELDMFRGNHVKLYVIKEDVNMIDDDIE